MNAPWDPDPRKAKLFTAAQIDVLKVAAKAIAWACAWIALGFTILLLVYLSGLS